MKSKNLSLFSKICKCYVKKNKPQSATDDDEDDSMIETLLDAMLQV